MGKKFEGANLTILDIVRAYLGLGLTDILGKPGDYTMFEGDRNLLSETIELHCVPGNFTGTEIRMLLNDAGLTAAA